MRIGSIPVAGTSAGTVTEDAIALASRTAFTSRIGTGVASSRRVRPTPGAHAPGPALKALEGPARTTGVRRRVAAPFGATGSAPLRPSMQASAGIGVVKAVAAAPRVAVATPSRSTRDGKLTQSTYQRPLSESCPQVLVAEALVVDRHASRCLGDVLGPRRRR